ICVQLKAFFDAAVVPNAALLQFSEQGIMVIEKGLAKSINLCSRYFNPEWNIRITRLIGRREPGEPYIPFFSPLFRGEQVSVQVIMGMVAYLMGSFIGRAP